MKNLLVFQHIECEHPGALRKYLQRDAVQVHTVNLDQGESIPDLHHFDALWVMGGPMDVWDVAENPWLIEEKKAIKYWVEELQKPYLGFVFGTSIISGCTGR